MGPHGAVLPQAPLPSGLRRPAVVLYRLRRRSTRGELCPAVGLSESVHWPGRDHCRSGGLCDPVAPAGLPCAALAVCRSRCVERRVAAGEGRGLKGGLPLYFATSGSTPLFSMPSVSMPSLLA